MPIVWLFESLVLVTVGTSILHDYFCYVSCYVIKLFHDDDDDDDSRKFGSSLNTSELF